VFPTYRLFVVAVAAGVGVLLWLLNEKTLIGARLRAAVDDPEMASGTGINVALLSGLVFAAGAGLAAFGGVMGGPILGGYPGIDFDLLPLAFVVVIIGGMGSLKGALVGSIVVGMIDNFGKALVPELSYFTLFAPMVIVLALKPTGLYGRA
jgi:branched-chain amino acid transport system permease protein